MLKYVDTAVTLLEIPDEITLCINISNCPCHCKGCHSPYLVYNIGKELTERELERLIRNNIGITCISFMGGDSNPSEINKLASHVWYCHGGEELAVAWYSGRQELAKEIDLKNFDYIKLGPYVEELGPLNSKTTNQRFYKVEDNKLINITHKFWK